MNNYSCFMPSHRGSNDLTLHLAMRVVLIALLFAGLSACSTLPRTSFTEQEQEIAQIADMSGVRFWADAPKAAVERAIGKAGIEEAARRDGGFTYLALSGGASDGAFGAGVLNGWTRRGGRPRFTLVSGVSAGALIAPLAFAGPEYDAHLTKAFTSGLAESLGDGGSSVFSLLGQADMRRRDTLHDIVASFVDERLLRHIASEHRSGRRLLVVTTNLDAQRAVVWNMGAIAASGSPRALSLFRDILTASASIPGAFAPSRIEVSANRRSFSELHVDGGVIMPVFTVPDSFIIEGDITRSPDSSIYVIMNSRLGAEFEVVEAGLLPLAGRSLSTLLKSQARLTLLTTLEYARSNGVGFNITYIGDDFPREMKADFTTEYMTAIYRYGYEKATSPRLWEQTLKLQQAATRRLGPR